MYDPIYIYLEDEKYLDPVFQHDLNQSLTNRNVGPIDRDCINHRCDHQPARWSDTMAAIRNEVEQLPRFKRQLVAHATDADRVEFCLAQSPVRNHIARFINRFTSCVNRCAWQRKSDAVAVMHRLVGNAEFCVGNMETALANYMLALAWAPKDSEEMALGFANRSAVFYRTKKYAASLVDIEMTREFNYSRHQARLLKRQCECLAHLGRMKEANHVFFSASSIVEQDRLELRSLLDRFEDGTNTPDASIRPSEENKFEQRIDELRQRGRFVPHYANKMINRKLKLLKVPGKGLQAVAKETIEAGEPLSIQKPYTAVLTGASRGDRTRCHHCLEPFRNMDLASIPCWNCPRVLYCSKHCQVAASTTYHRFECAHLAMLHQLRDYHMAIRVLYMTSPEQICDIVCGRIPTTGSQDSSTTGSLDYWHMYQLYNGAVKLNYEQLIDKTLTACLLTQLVFASGYVTENYKHILTEKVIGGLLLRHITQMFLHSVPIHCTDSPDHLVSANAAGPRFLDDQANIIGFALNISSRLWFGHSCDPNGKWFAHATDSSIPASINGIIRATRPIVPGEQVNITYGVHYGNDRLQMRQTHLLQRYYFHCQCDRCEVEKRDHPQIDIYPSYYPIACALCLDSLVNQSSGQFYCMSCGAGYTWNEMKCRYRTIKSTFQKVGLLMTQAWLANNHTEMERLMGQAEYLLDHVSFLLHCSAQLAQFFYALSNLCAKMDLLPKALQLAERCLSLTSKCYGTLSWQVAEKVFELAELYDEAVRKNVIPYEKRIVEIKKLVVKYRSMFLD